MEKRLTLVTETATVMAEVRELDEQCVGLERLVNLPELQTPEEFQKAAAWGQTVADRIKAVKSFFAPHKRRAFEAHRGLCEEEDRRLAMLEAAKEHVRMRLKEYRRKEDAAIAAENARREAEARQHLQTVMLDEAVALDEAGFDAEARALLDEAESAKPPVLAVFPTKAPGAVFRAEPTFRVVDESKVKDDFWIPRQLDMAKIKATVKRLKKGAEIVVGGIVVEEDVNVSLRP